MLFDAKDLHPGYTLEEIEKLFFLRKDLSDFSEQDKEALLAKVNSLGLKDIRLDTVQMLLCVMHEAREIDQPRFLKTVFLPWHELRQKTRPHFERIGEELSRIGEFEPGSIKEAAHAANVYRNIVSDLFDPYLTLVVACFQFKDGKFTSLDDADLAQGERNKFQYLAARVKEIYKGQPNFLSGYDPLVRNAISHSGARGVTYGADRVVFKNIKRGTPVGVETVIWSFDELQSRVIQLLECIQSIEVASKIFGFDCAQVIGADFDTYCQFVLHAVPPERRAELRERHGRLVERIRQCQRTIGGEARGPFSSPVLQLRASGHSMPRSEVFEQRIGHHGRSSGYGDRPERRPADSGPGTGDYSLRSLGPISVRRDVRPRACGRDGRDTEKAPACR